MPRRSAFPSLARFGSALVLAGALTYGVALNSSAGGASMGGPSPDPSISAALARCVRPPVPTECPIGIPANYGLDIPSITP